MLREQNASCASALKFAGQNKQWQKIVDETSFRTIGVGAKLSKGKPKYRCLKTVDFPDRALTVFYESILANCVASFDFVISCTTCNL